MNIEHFDVVVVGLGPVGAVVANLLGARGVRTLVVERDPQINRAPRAIGSPIGSRSGASSSPATPRTSRRRSPARAWSPACATPRTSRGRSPRSFRKHRGDRWRPGTAFPQALVAHAGLVKPSDDVLGGELCLVGVGVDPASRLGDEERARWQAVGGRIVQITHRGQRLDLGSDSDRCEDVTGRFLSASRSLGWAAVVRPDRMVLCEGPVHDSPRLVEETLGLLDAPRTTLQQRSTPERARKDMP